VQDTQQVPWHPQLIHAGAAPTVRVEPCTGSYPGSGNSS
jgi:hypothetical protein